MTAAPPHGWSRHTIGSLCRLVNGRAFKPSEWTKAGLPIIRIQNLNNEDAPFNYFDGEIRPQFLVNSGDLLFAWSGTPGTSFGAHVWQRGPAVLNQHIFKVLFDEGEIDKYFLKLAINQKLDELIEKAHGGVGLRHVTKGKFEATQINLPTLDQQRRIVATLDTLFSASTNARHELGRIPHLIDRYKNAIISTALRGSFTGRWRRDKGTSVDSWANTSLAELCLPERTITYGVIKLGPEVPDGIPCLRTSNVRWLDIETQEMKRISPALSNKYARTILDGDEILVNVRGTLGGVAVASSQMKGWNVSREIAVVPVDVRKADPHFVAYWVASDESQRWLSGVQRGVAYTGINLSDLRRLQVSLPSLEEQKQIVRHIRLGLDIAAKVAKEAERAETLLNRLDAAILSKAFRGELMIPLEDALFNASSGQSATPSQSNSELKAADKVRRRTSVQRVTLESAREIIRSMPEEHFSFDDLREHLVGDYETLREIVFGLLAEPSPVISQVFDSQRKSIVFSRSHK